MDVPDARARRPRGDPPDRARWPAGGTADRRDDRQRDGGDRERASRRAWTTTSPSRSAPPSWPMPSKPPLNRVRRGLGWLTGGSPSTAPPCTTCAALMTGDDRDALLVARRQLLSDADAYYLVSMLDRRRSRRRSITLTRAGPLAEVERAERSVPARPRRALPRARGRLADRFALAAGAADARVAHAIAAVGARSSRGPSSASGGCCPPWRLNQRRGHRTHPRRRRRGG